MEIYDFLMISVIVAATFFGAWKGLVWQIASLGAIVASYVVALRFRDPVSSFVQAEPPWNVFVAMLLLYVGTSLVIWILFRMVSRFVNRMKLTEFDRQVGAVFGFAKGILLCVIITLFSVTLLGDAQRQAIVRSRSGAYIARLLNKSSAVMPREVHDVLDPYINSLDQRLQAADGPFPGTENWPLQIPDVGAGGATNPTTAVRPSEFWR
jgi:membrane protein required for colicin V production